MQDEAEHCFGGDWTLVKLDLLGRYLEAFNTALQNQPRPERPFRRIYIDAFAGTGRCSVTINGEDVESQGSAGIALNANPLFDTLYFVDIKKKHVKALSQLAADNSGRDIEVFQGDCNEQISKILSKVHWRSSRAVMFLDPYGMTVEWETLRKIAETQAIDVWYLFPLSAACRQAAHSFDKVDQSKFNALTRLFGTESWIEDFYKETPQDDMFANIGDPTMLERQLDQRQIQLYAKKRLQTLFPLVLDPKQLPETGSPLFSLFFMSSNPSPRSMRLATSIAGHLLDPGKTLGRSKARLTPSEPKGSNLSLLD